VMAVCVDGGGALIVGGWAWRSGLRLNAGSVRIWVHRLVLGVLLFRRMYRIRLPIASRVCVLS
jgi:hypothetical protein